MLLNAMEKPLNKLGSRPKWRRFSGILFMIYVSTLLILLVIPTGGSMKLSKYFLGIRVDHFIHTTLFLPFMMIIWFGNYHRNQLRLFMLYLLTGILFCAFCESLHYFIPYRSFDIHDFYANLTGLFLGAGVFLFRRSG